MKTKIEYVKNKIHPGGWIGMNELASKQLKVPWKHKRYPMETIEIYSKEPKQIRLNTEHHEEAERYAMRIKHENYHQAHQFALKFEKQHKSFPQNHEKTKLKKMGFKF